MIAKAVGFQGKSITVFDATFGLGQDAWTLARLGCYVIGCERESLLFHLFQESLELAKLNAKTKEVALRIQLFNIDAIELLASSAKYIDRKIDTVFLDPMFPDLKKSALPKIEMQLLRNWLGHGTPRDEELLQKSRAFGDVAERFRVVVKRPLKAPVLASGFFHQFKGKTIRYDCYKGFSK